MNHKISIENLGPIKKIDNFEIKNVNLIIGESASGKSILAKAIMLFNDTEDFFESLFSDDMSRLKTIMEEFFPSYQNYSINYAYTEECSVKLTHKNNEVTFELSKQLQELQKNIQHVQKQIENIQKNQTIQRLLDELGEDNFSNLLEKLDISQLSASVSSVKNNFFKELNILNTIFVPATRSFVSDFDELRLSRLNRMPDDRFQAGDKTLRLFSETYRSLLRNFKKFPTDIENSLLKGTVIQDEDYNDISIYFEKQKIDSSQWSSGQKEVFPILLILQHIVVSQRPYFLIIEEPESHLFPKDQRIIFENIIESVEQTNSTVFITTHSPYMLMSANNLIEAKRKNYQPYKSKFIDEKTINVSKIKDGKVASLMDDETRLIDGEYIESIADDICDKYDEILNS